MADSKVNVHPDTQPAGLYGAPELPQQAHTTAVEDKIARERSLESGSLNEKRAPAADAHAVAAEHDEEAAERERAERRTFYQRFRPFILAASALLILGWWISATILEATRHRW